MSRLAREDPVADPTPAQRVWEHKDYTICKSRDTPKPLPEYVLTKALVVHFDGGYKAEVGAGGFLVWGKDGKCLGGQGKSYAGA